MEADPVFFRVTLWGALVDPAATLPKANDAGDSVACATAADADNKQAIAVKNRTTETRDLQAHPVPRTNMVKPPSHLRSVPARG
jgi:hypothetical protein